MTECGLLMPLEIKKELAEDHHHEEPKESGIPILIPRETENVSPQRRSPQDTTDEELDFQLTGGDGNVNVLAKEASVSLPPVITVGSKFYIRKN